MSLNQIRLAVVGSGALAVIGLIVWKQSRRRTQRDATEATPSPLQTAIPHLNSLQIARLAYSPDYFPGARDVYTTFGTTRVYEFGSDSASAPKVLFVHGISTPCISLGGLAMELVAKGCRVILFGKLLFSPVATLLAPRLASGEVF